MNAKFIISGDRDLLEFGKYQGVEIVTADKFLRIVEKNLFFS